jgi:hypothetical protein
MAMRTIDLQFESLEELPIAELFGVHGVYVLWAPTARDCPTYLGEGVILSRLNDHVKWLKSGVTGIAAAIGSKREAELVEATLLWTAEVINRWPTQNSAPGKRKRIDTMLEKHTSLRINVRGKHPFTHPTSKYSNLRERVPISVWPDGDDYVIEPPWNRRS